VKYREIIADNLSKASWSWGCVSAVDFGGRTIFVADAHRGQSYPAMIGLSRQQISSLLPSGDIYPSGGSQ
jgi:hypothetical protein